MSTSALIFLISMSTCVFFFSPVIIAQHAKEGVVADRLVLKRDFSGNLHVRKYTVSLSS